VFIVATANDVTALPPEMLRKGRFDEVFFIDLPDAAEREQIYAIHLAKRKRDPKNYDLKSLARASKGFSGAEIEQAVVSALHECYGGKTELSTEMIVTALKESPPLSVTMREKMLALYEWAQGRCVEAE
jgi:SpoVK/Ycf46/Vps4 family AAA+-type ATPase